MSHRILVGIGGGIAAYKICEVISTLVKAGYEVRAMLTQSAQQFITPLTVTTLCRHPIYDDASFWQPHHTRPLHIALAEWADVLLLAPLTANTLAKLVHGLADNLVTNTVLASDCPILVAPAMNTTMWQQPSVQANWHQLLAQDRYHVVGPASGLLACDTEGMGRMAEPGAIVTHVKSLCYSRGTQDLLEQRVLVSAGGTREFLDPVRFIGNPSTGKMGVALAQAASHRGAQVCLVHGPLRTGLPMGVTAIATPTAAEMRAALLAEFPAADWTLMAAAVADVKPANPAAHKLPKRDLPEALPLAPVPDIVAELGQHKQANQGLIGFAAQSGDIVTPAKDKLSRKRLDAIVANPIDVPERGFGCDRNEAIWLDRTGRQLEIPLCTKLAMAHRILDLMLELKALS